jgi:hypothetical protein
MVMSMVIAAKTDKIAVIDRTNSAPACRRVSAESENLLK